MEKWELFKIKRTFCALDDFKQAKQKEKLAELTSDLDRENWEETTSSRKRKISRPLRFCVDSDDSVEDQEESNLPRPPKIITSSAHASDFRSSKNSWSSQSSEGSEDLKNFSNDIPAFGQNRKYIKKPENSKCSQKETLTDTNYNAVTLTTSKEAFQMLVTHVSTCVEQNKTILEQNKGILRILRDKNHNLLPPLRNDRVQPVLPVPLPLNTLDEINVLEDYLTNSIENRQHLCTYLSFLNRTDLISCTNSSMRYCFTYKLAKTFSWKGTKQDKQAFCNYCLKKVIIDAVKIAIPLATQRNIEDRIKIWLKSATKSYALEQEKERKQRERDGI